MSEDELPPVAGMDTLSGIDDHLGPRWPMDLVGAALHLFDAGVEGLLLAGPDTVLAFRHHDVRLLTVASEAGNTPVDVLMRRALDRGAVTDRERGFFPIVSNTVFSYNPPLHPPARRILTRQMTPKNISRFEELARRVLAGVLGEISHTGTFDVCADFAQRIAARFWGALIGLDAEQCQEIQEVTEVLGTVFLVAPTTEQSEALDAAVQRYMELVTDAVERALADPDSSAIDPVGVELLREMADDLAAMSEPGAPESVGLMAAGNFFEGFHTMGVGLANATYQLLAHPDSYEVVRANVGLAINAYDEGTRLTPPLILTHRYALADFVHGGVKIPAGTLIAMHWAGANLDPHAFDQPQEYRLDRPTRGLTTFGGGPHLCPGRNISRLVSEMALTALVRQPASLTLASVEPDWIGASSTTQLRTCPVIQSA